MKETKPEVFLVGMQLIDWPEVERYFDQVGVSEFQFDGASDQDDLVTFAGKLCYRSWEPGLNKNITRVREDQASYIENILRSGHGSVLEHVNFNFVFRHVSRVFTHELVRHRAGSAFSQESLRFVRLDELNFWFPDWVPGDLKPRLEAYLREAEQLQRDMSQYFGLDNPKVPFDHKKAKTSFMRRFAPEGLATDILWTANARTVRHVVAERTAPGAEEEIRLVFGEVARKVKAEAPYIFQDFEKMEDDTWLPQYRKV